MPLFSNQEKSLVFIHIPKCGGSSVEEVLKKHSTHMSIFYLNEEHDFPCNPQHFQYELLKHLVPNFGNTPSFAIVRHPVLRTLSEYKYKQKMLSKNTKKPQSIEREIRSYFKDYSFNQYVHDNHIRPQIEFVTTNCRIFKLENGLHAPINYANSILYGTETPREKQADKVPSILKSTYNSLILTGRTINRIQSFYNADTHAFGYSKIDISDKEQITYAELKHELLKGSLEKVDMAKVNSTKEFYKPYQHPTKPLMNFSSKTIERFFKLLAYHQ